MSTAQDAPQDGDEGYGWNIQFSAPSVIVSEEDDFNEYGVREHDDGSIDVIFAAMEPGERKGIRVTDSFLRRVASHQYGDRLPLQYDHSHSQRANVGWIEPENIKFSDGFLRVMAHIPNTGSQIRTDTIADFTHDPPAISDGSVGFDFRSIKVERSNDPDDKPEFKDARLQEFSLTPFPAGYDNGGLSPQFSRSVDDFMTPDESNWGESCLLTRPYRID
ncbi:hypothetical protein HTZ84_09565 [Haloterrigena sp. SYSU A558-1]|uniref:HK97 family phage prohead protease n=1 Tax=Haloterrigena gelatinilytica TaxID=2741724 RepID=A0ABX2LAY8_9EURY|nr:hypothetical protein [Haloterrigena gelatinilytica]NUC72553.1 hypothetical protein [Haloterrigena gelatinilytica]